MGDIFMKFKYIILVSLILAILTLNAVSASQDDMNLTAVEEVQDSLAVDENLADDSPEVIASEDTQEIIGDDDNRKEVDDYYVSAPSRVCTGATSKIGMWIEADDLSGNFTFSLNNQVFYDAPVEWDDDYEDYRHYLHINELNLQPGINNLTFKYSGDYNYKPVSEDFTIDAYYFKAFPTPKTIYIYGDYATQWTVEAGDMTGHACVLIDDEVYMNDTIANLIRDYGTTDYTFRISFLNCSYGNHTYNIRYYNGKYDDMEYNGTFTVDYYFVFGYITSFSYPEPITLTYILPNDFTGNFTITVDGENYTAYAEKGRGSFIYNYTDLKDYLCTATFETEKYPKKVLSETVSAKAKINVNSSAYYGDDDIITLVLPADANGNLTVYKRNEDYTKGDVIATKALVDGKASFGSAILDMGYNYLIIEYNGTDYAVDLEDYCRITFYPKLIYPEKVNNQFKYNVTAISSDNAIGNLTLKIYDESYELLMTFYNGPAKGEVTVELPYLESGSYYLESTYNDENQPWQVYLTEYLYVGASDYNWTMNVEFPQEIEKSEEYSLNGTFWITNIPEACRGYIVLYVDGKRIDAYEIWDDIYDDGAMTFSLSSLSLGNHAWEVRLVSSEYYVAKPVNGTFELIPYVPPKKDVDDYDVRASSTVCIGATSKIGMWVEAEDLTGNFTFILNGQVFYDAPVEWDDDYEDYRHYMFINELDLKPGINNLTFKYSGDDIYNPVSEDFTIDAYYFKAFTVPKTIYIYGDYATHWTVEAGDMAGHACVLIDDEVYMNDTIANLIRDYGTSNYTFRITFLNCSYGNHNYSIRYYGGKYDDVTYNGTFTVDYYFTFGYITSFSYPEPITMTYTLPNDFTGNFTITVDGENYTAYVEKGKGTFIYNYTDFKDYLFTATFESEKYPKKVLNEIVSIPATIMMPFYADYGDDDVITLVLPADANGNLTVYKRNFDGTKGDMIATKALVDGKASFSSIILDMGTNYLKLEYTGDDYSVGLDNYGQITIHPKLIYPEKVNNQLKYDVTAISSDNAIGNLTMEICDYDWDEVLMTLYAGPAKGEVTVELPYLESGNYGLKIIYNDENQPFEVVSAEYLYVGESDYNWTMNVEFPQKIAKEDVYYYSSGSFRVTNIPEDGWGYIVLYVDGKRIDYYEIWDDIYYDGGMTFSLSALSLGNHSWEVRLASSDYYVAQPVNGTFELIPYDFPEIISYDGNTYALYFDLNNESANAFLNVLIDGKDYKMVHLEKGKAEIKLTDLPLGKHAYNLVCTGDVNTNFTGSFDVEMDFLNVRNSYIYYYGELSDVRLGLPSYAKGNVTLTVNDKSLTSKIENGIVSFDLSDLSVGSNLLIAKYAGDDINSAQEIKLNLTIRDYTVRTVYTDDYSRFIGFSLTLPSNADGILSIYNKSNSAFIKSVPLVDGKAFFKVEDQLNFGIYNLLARYESENNDYNVTEVSKSFTYAPLVDVPESIYVGENATVTVDFKNATGNVTVLIDHAEYVNLTIQDGKISLSIPYSEFSSSSRYHSISFIYHGNDFDPNVLNYAGQPASYLIYILSNPVVIPKTIANGETAYVTAELLDNATGYIVLKVTGNGITSIYNMTFSKGGNISVPIPILPAGGYWLDLSYEDVCNGRSYGESQYVTVLKPEPTLEIVSPTDTNVPVLIFNLSKDATGGIVVVVDGKNYGLNLVGGSANMTIPGLDNGDYSVKVTYSGDDNYLGFDKTMNVTVDANQYEPKVVASDLTMVYTAGSLYKATVWGANGKLASNVEVTFLINGKVFKTVKTDANGVASVKLTQVPGTYKIAAKSLGKSVTKKLTVKHVLTLKKVTVKRSAKKLVLTATLAKVNGKYLKNKKITFKFKGKKYTAKTNAKGVAKVTIKKSVLKKLKKGKKVTYQATYLKDTVKKSVKVKK
jgi:hypothetical protein